MTVQFTILPNDVDITGDTLRIRGTFRGPNGDLIISTDGVFPRNLELGRGFDLVRRKLSDAVGEHYVDRVWETGE